uniref:Protein phosphatase 6 regulatory subunit 1 n=1 Tax=Pelusios castaneus TaxID=367368 RepID=A0A8C8STZ5_9SAUR
MGILISRKTDQIVAFLRKEDDFVSLLLRHIGTSAVMDLLLRLLTCVEQPPLRQDVFNWLNEEKIVQRLIEMIHPSKDENQHSNASQSLCDIIRLSREQMIQFQDSPEPDQLLATLEKQETVEQLLANMLVGEQVESVLVSGIQVLLTLLEPSRARSEAVGLGSFYGPLDGQPELGPRGMEGGFCQASPSTLLALRQHLRDFHQLLLHPPKRPALQMTWGLLDPPLGNTRLQVVKLLGSALGAGDAGLQAQLLELDALNTMLDLYFRYSYNNFLHAQLEACLSAVLQSPAPTQSAEGDLQALPDSPVVKHLLQKCRLVQRILSAWEENEQTQAAGGQRRGYMGHLTRIANTLVQSTEKGPHAALLGQLLKELPEEEQERWETFVSGPLAETNKKNVVDLVSTHNLHSSSDDEENDLKEFSFPQYGVLQQAFADYQMQQVTSAFIDHFGFNDEEFGEQEESVNAPFDKMGNLSFSLSADDESPNSNLFEVCYKERIQQFDEDDSDGEDAWQQTELGYVGGAPAGPRSCGSTDSEGSRDSEEEEEEGEEEDAGGGVEGGGGSGDEGPSPTASADSVPAEPHSSGGVDTGAAVWDGPSSDTSQPPTEGSWALFTDCPQVQKSLSGAPSRCARGPLAQEPTHSSVPLAGAAPLEPPCAGSPHESSDPALNGQSAPSPVPATTRANVEGDPQSTSDTTQQLLGSTDAPKVNGSPPEAAAPGSQVRPTGPPAPNP